MKVLFFLLMALAVIVLMCFLIPEFAGALIMVAFIFFVVFAIGFFLRLGGFIVF